MGGRERWNPASDNAATAAGPPEDDATRVVLHLTPDAVSEGFLALEEPDRAAERFPELVGRFGRGEQDEIAEIAALAARSGIVPLYDVRTVDPEVLRFLRELNEATYRDDFRPPDLLAYLALDLPTAAEARRFLDLVLVEGGAGGRFPGAVDDAYLEPILPEDTGGATHLGLPVCAADVLEQWYLRPAPAGLDVDALGRIPGSDGAGVRLYDLELGFGPGHAAVPAPTLDGLGSTSPAAVHHLSVMGVICSRHGMRPVAPGVAYGHVSPFGATGKPDHAAAIVSALARLGPGDVLLSQYTVTHRETNRDQAPPEIVPAIFGVISAVTRRIDPATSASLGIHVVAAAGNGRWRMDRATGRFDRPGAPPRRVLLGDSGAILVGSADALVPHRRWRTSNHGTRIDCYAWGEKLVTATKAHAGAVSRDAFTCGFGETSGAAALIAGAVAALQGIAHTAGRGPIDPLRLRAWLGDPDLGTPVYAFHGAAIPRGPLPAGGRRPPPATTPVGSMPDLSRVAARLLGG